MLYCDFNFDCCVFVFWISYWFVFVAYRLQIDFIFDVYMAHIVYILLSYLFAFIYGFLIGRLWHLLYVIFGIYLLYIDVKLVYIFIYCDVILTTFIDCILFAFRVRIAFPICALFFDICFVFLDEMCQMLDWRLFEF